MNSRSLGRHILIELRGCDSSLLDDVNHVRDSMMRAARDSGATIVRDVFHEFNPQGLSGVVVIAESHLAIHTWPEFRCASIDIFSCSARMRPEVAIECLSRAFRAETVEIQVIPRGIVLAYQGQHRHS